MEKINYSGLWYVEGIEEQIPGGIQLNDDGSSELNLFGAEQLISLLHEDKIEIINGFADQKYFTLLNCWKRGFTAGRGISIKFKPEVTFIGAHFPKKEDIKFSNIYIEYSYLSDWVDISGFQIEHSNGLEEWKINYKLPAKIDIANLNDLNISISPSFNTSDFPLVLKEFSITQKYSIAIEATEEKPFDNFLNLIFEIRDFLSFAISEPVAPIKITAYSEINKEEINGRILNPPIEILFKTKLKNKVRDIIPMEMLFTYNEIKERSNDIFKNWFSKKDKLKPVYDLYSSALQNPNIYLENLFLSYAQALETYHRRVYNNYEIDLEEHKKRINSIIESAPANYISWLKEKLFFSNELSLKQRLEHLFLKYKEAIVPFVTEEDIIKIKNTRNYLTHYDQRLEKKSASVDELIDLSLKLRLMIEACLLDELGFNLDEIKKCLSRIRDYYHLRKK